jgi:hypothetical protein
MSKRFLSRKTKHASSGTPPSSITAKPLLRSIQELRLAITGDARGGGAAADIHRRMGGADRPRRGASRLICHGARRIRWCRPLCNGRAVARSIIERLGATFIDRSEPVADYATRLTGWRAFDIVYDTPGGDTYSGVFTLLTLLTGEGRSHHGDILAQATRLAEAHQLVPLIDPRRFSLGSVESAYNAHRDRDAQGKIFIDAAAAEHGQTFLDALART